MCGQQSSSAASAELRGGGYNSQLALDNQGTGSNNGFPACVFNDEDVVTVAFG